MAVTLLLDGFLLWGVGSYVAAGRALTTADWIVSAVLVGAVLGALVVLLRLIGGRRPGWLALLVVILGLAFPVAVAVLIALSGPPIV